MDDRDPVEDGLRGTDEDLYDVATWEERTILDRTAGVIHAALRRGGGGVLILFAVLLLVAQVGIIGYAIYVNPKLGALTLFSIVPGVLLVWFVWYQDATMSEPWDTMAATYLLAIAFASFAATVNTILQPLFKNLIPVVGTAVFFLVIVGPVEETVKWLAVRIYAFEGHDFDAVIDGAVYGAIAGLGFATIENALYITQSAIKQGTITGADPIREALRTATARAFVGPGHVLWSSYAGYYLGLAKFNRERAGAIVVRGLFVAAMVHAIYNIIVTYVPFLDGLLFVAFVLVYDGAFAYVLYRKLARYREKYKRATRRGSDLEPAIVRVTDE